MPSRTVKATDNRLSLHNYEGYARHRCTKRKRAGAICWRPVQWQAIVIIGGAVIRNRTCPHRHPEAAQAMIKFMISPAAAPLLRKVHEEPA